MVTVGQTVLNTISTNDPMAVDFLVNEKQLATFEALERKKQQPADSLFTILLPDNTLYPYVGKISVIDRAVDAQTGAIRVRLEFPNHNYDLKVGMSCVVRVHNQDIAPQMLIPGKAVVEQMGEYFVFVVRDTIIIHADSTRKKEPDTTSKVPSPHAFQKKVMLGQTIGANVIVKEGISEGDRIVVDGVQLLHDGSRVALDAKKTDAEKGNTSDSTANADRINDKSKKKN
jgi:membrane fusion protein (multidrug efflux system)